MGKKRDLRFRVVHKESRSLTTETKILQDRRTGVLYLWQVEANAGGLTVLVDRDGKPLIDYVQPDGHLV